MAISSNLNAAAIALNRFGLGARPGDAPPADPKAWLLAQLEQYEPRPAAWENQPNSVALSGELEQQRTQFLQQGQRKADNVAASPVTNVRGDERPVSQGASQIDKGLKRKAVRVEIRDMYRSSVNARVTSALTTQTPFVERMVHFWANHFAISTEKPAVAALAGSFEAEAIRPHVLGRFEDMLVAVERHPAMQLFLDQTRSVGPHSAAAMRAAQHNADRKRGLNENLAREIMELHTLGVRSGYSQDDVTEFARALTGWTDAASPTNPAKADTRGMTPAQTTQSVATPTTFVFREALHEPGVRTVMGRRYDQPGEEQALAILHDLASAPATAQHIGTKLARHFISDDPPASASAQLASAFQRSGGDLPTVYRALIDMREVWSPMAVKFKTPWEWIISSMRGLGWHEQNDVQAAALLAQLGQPVWRSGSPAGYDDVAASWAAPDALVRRVEVAQRFASRVGDQLDARSLGQVLLAGSLSAPSATAISHADSASTAIALLLVSPEFLRR